MGELTEAASAGGRKLNILGVLIIVLGALAMMAPGLTGMSIALMVGVIIIAAGTMRIVWAFQAASVGQGLLIFLVGGLTLVCGIAMVSSPLLAAGVLTIVITAYLLLDGACEVVAGLQMRPEPGSGWMLFSGAVSVVLGIMIWRQFPLSGPWAIGVLLGIKLLFVGLTMVMIGTRVRSVAHAVEARLDAPES